MVSEGGLGLREIRIQEEVERGGPLSAPGEWTFHGNLFWEKVNDQEASLDVII